MSAFVVSNRNIMIPHPAGGAPCRLTRGSMGPVPDWVPETAYFKALEADGKVILSSSQKDKDIEKGQRSAKNAARKAAERGRKAAGAAEGKVDGEPGEAVPQEAAEELDGEDEAPSRE